MNRHLRRPLRLPVVVACLTWSALAVPPVSSQDPLGPLPVTPMPDDGKTPETIHEVPILAIDPPEQGFFSKRLDYRGLPIKAHEVVVDDAFYEAWRRIHNLLKNNPTILDNLRRAGSEIHIIGRDQGQTDLPDFLDRKGVPLAENPNMTLDERARGMGGRHCSCGEENLLLLPGDRYRGRDILSHEFTHTIHGHGVSQNIRDRIRQTWIHALENGLWINPATRRPFYAGTNENEYLAELMLWYVGGRGDWPRTGRGRRSRRGGAAEASGSRGDSGAGRRRGRATVDPDAPIVVRGVTAGEPVELPPMEPGPEFIEKYDPMGYELVDDLVMGRLEVEHIAPRPRRGRRRGR